MTIEEAHAKIIEAYREAVEGSDYEGIEIIPVDRQKDTIRRPSAETVYDASYSKEMMLRVMTLDEELYFYPQNAKIWKADANVFQELIETRLFKGIDDLEIYDIDCSSGRDGDLGGVLQITFSAANYEVIPEDEYPEMEQLELNQKVED